LTGREAFGYTGRKDASIVNNHIELAARSSEQGLDAVLYLGIAGYVERQHLDTLSAKSYGGSAISASQVTNPAVDLMDIGGQSFGHVATETTGRSSDEDRFASFFHIFFLFSYS
jgi:hypothetical protein